MKYEIEDKIFIINHLEPCKVEITGILPTQVAVIVPKESGLPERMLIEKKDVFYNEMDCLKACRAKWLDCKRRKEESGRVVTKLEQLALLRIENQIKYLKSLEVKNDN